MVRVKKDKRTKKYEERTLEDNIKRKPNQNQIQNQNQSKD